MMTTTDLIGATLAVVLAIALAAAYFYAFRPKHKQQFDDLSNWVNEDEPH